MRLVRQVPSNAVRVGSGMSLFREFVFYYIADGVKYVKIVTPRRSYCYTGYDCF